MYPLQIDRAIAGSSPSPPPVPRSEAVVPLPRLEALLLRVTGDPAGFVEFAAEASYQLLGVGQGLAGVVELGVQVLDLRLGGLRRGDRVQERLLGLRLLGG